jgi:signal transduction histidine kinase/CheY-like chemotaxis protein
MRISHHLAYRQAIQTVIAAFLLGLVLSAIQIGYDVFQEQKQVDSTVHEIINMLRDTAAESLVSFDVASSENVVNGLFEYQPIREARVVDDLGSVFAHKERPAVQGSFIRLVHLMFGHEKHYRVPLFYEDEHETPVGHIEVSLDSYLIARNFLKRAQLILISDLARNVMLSGVLLLLFYYTLTRPLLDIVRHVSSVDPSLPAKALLQFPKSHKHDEMRLLVRTVNQLLRKFDENLTRRRQAEETLQKHRENLEDIVNIRTQELQIAKEDAEKANVAKSRFLANMSHELRTPLNAILGFAQIMARNPNLPPEEQENLSIIQRSGEHLLRLINQVLDLSKIEAGRITLNAKDFNLHRLLDDLEDMFSLKAQNKGLHLVFERADDVPQYVRTDEIRLRQVLINLLSNGIKFTEEGGVTVRIENCQLNIANWEEEKNRQSLRIRSGQASIVNLQFSISDTGPGIAPEELSHLFDAFVQTKTGRQAKEGTGLGLPISRKFVQLMGGDITVTSEVGRGTIVRFDIQATVVEETDFESVQPIRRAIALEPGQPRHRLLIVDDNPDSRALLVKLLNPFGFELQEATNGQEAIDIWEQWDPHLIWMDLRMPVMSGYEATQQIRATDKGKDTVIITLSASSFGEERAIALSQGCDDFLRKPFREHEIFGLLHRHLGVRFVYEEEQRVAGRRPQATGKKVLTPEALATLPDELRAGLHHAVEVIDLETVNSLVDQIREHNEPLAEALAELVKNYRFDTLQELFGKIEQRK